MSRYDYFILNEVVIGMRTTVRIPNSVKNNIDNFNLQNKHRIFNKSLVWAYVVN